MEEDQKLNSRHKSYLNRMDALKQSMVKNYAEAQELNRWYREEFDQGQPHDFSKVTNLYDRYNYTSEAIAAVAKQGMLNYCNYWDGEDVDKRPYGKDWRSV